MRILSISALYHDSAAAVVIDGEAAAAAQEERFTRKKHDALAIGNGPLRKENQAPKLKLHCNGVFELIEACCGPLDWVLTCA